MARFSIVIGKMSESDGAKQSEVAELTKVLNELRESVKPAKERKPWIYTEARKANYERANAKRLAAAERKKVEAAIQEAERKAFEEERRKFYEMSMKNPTGNTVSQAPDLNVSASAPNKPPTVSQSAPVPVAEVPEKKEVRFVEKPIMADEVESVAHEHDHDDGWMTRANSKVAPTASASPEPESEEEAPPLAPAPLQRQTNAAAVAADWAENQMQQMVSRKRAREVQEQLAQAQAMQIAPSYRVGTGAGNHAPYEGDRGYVDERQSAVMAHHNMVSPEEALQLLSMPKDQALRYLAQRISHNPREQRQMLRPYHDREPEYMEPDVGDFLSHTRHYSQRHPSQLHNSTHSARYQPAGDEGQFLWL